MKESEGERSLSPEVRTIDPSEGLDRCFDTTEEEKVFTSLNTELDLQIKQMIIRQEGVWKCKLCGKTSYQKGLIRNHTETHIKGEHICGSCNKVFSTRHSLGTHISNIHCVNLATCNICGKTGMNKMTYSNHKNKEHRI